MTEPVGWTSTTIGAVTTKPLKLDPKKSGRAYVRYVDIGLLDSPTIPLRDAPWLASAEAPSRCRQVISTGDTLYSTVRPYLRKIALIGAELDGEFASTGFSALRPDPQVDPRFLAYFTQSPQFEAQILPNQKGVSYPAVLDREVRSCRIWCPSIGEQHRLGELIEEHLARLDAAGAALTLATRRGDALRSSLMDQLSNPLDPVSRLDGLALIGTGTTPSRSRKDLWEPGTVPWVTSGDIKHGKVTTVDGRISAAALEQTSLRLYPPGTLLVAMYGEGKTRGSVATLQIEATVNQACAAVQVTDPGLTPWIQACLEAQYHKLRKMAAGGVQPNLNLSLVRSIEIPMPSAADRERRLSDVSSSLDMLMRLKRHLATHEQRSIGLRRAVLQAAFSGRLTGGSADGGVIEEMAEASEESS